MARLSKEYRREAARITKPFAGILAVICLIYIAIEMIIDIEWKTGNVYPIYGDLVYEEAITPLAILTVFVAGPFHMSWHYISQKVNVGGKPEIKELFYGFKDFKRSFIAYLLISIYTALWSLISFGILGIVKSYSYSMTYFILEENPNMSVKEAITESRRIMNGKKWRLFCLELSYIGWYLLSFLTLGILLLWVEPRVHQAKYLFMKDAYEEAGFIVNDSHFDIGESYIENN